MNNSPPLPCLALQRGDKLVEYEGKEEKEMSRSDFKCPEGWLWKGDWKIDKNRAVDEEGKR